jgi:hypothetical protein
MYPSFFFVAGFAALHFRLAFAVAADLASSLAFFAEALRVSQVTGWQFVWQDHSLLCLSLFNLLVVGKYCMHVILG